MGKSKTNKDRKKIKRTRSQKCSGLMKCIGGGSYEGTYECPHCKNKRKVNLNGHGNRRVRCGRRNLFEAPTFESRSLAHDSVGSTEICSVLATVAVAGFVFLYRRIQKVTSTDY